MSDYCEMKVIRMPANPEDFGVSDIWDLEKKYPELFKYQKTNYFSIAPTEKRFIDYVLYDEYPSGAGDIGMARYLSDKEAEKFVPIFKQIKEDVTKDDLRFVHFCWYNCCEAPDYYEVEDYG